MGLTKDIWGLQSNLKMYNTPLFRAGSAAATCCKLNVKLSMGRNRRAPVCIITWCKYSDNPSTLYHFHYIIFIIIIIIIISLSLYHFHLATTRILQAQSFSSLVLKGPQSPSKSQELKELPRIRWWQKDCFWFRFGFL